MKNYRMIKRYLMISSISMLSTVSLHAIAANTQTFVNNVSDLGNADAATTVVTDDASVQYYNPAGLTYIDKQQIVFGSSIGTDRKTFRGSTLFSLDGLEIPQNGKAVANVIAVLPFFYYSLPIKDRYYFGIGFSAFGGTGQNFPTNSILRYTSTKSLIAIVDAGPAFAAKINDKLSVGLGLDMEYLYAELNQMVPTGIGPDAKLFNYGGNYGYGWHAGILYAYTPATKIGLDFRSRVNFNVDGSSTYVANPGAPLKTEFNTNNFNFSTATAPTIALGVSHEINNQWKVMAGLVYEQWDILKKETLNNIATPFGPEKITAILNYHNTWRYEAAANYKPTEKWLLRAGIAYNQDPTNHDTVAADDVPNTNLIFLAIGARYQMTKDASMDLAYGHYFLASTNIGFNLPPYHQSGTLEIDNSNILGVQFNFNV